MKCREWLREKLGDSGTHLCEDVRAAAREAGFSRAELRQACKETGVKTFHQFDEDGETQNWFWYLEVRDARKGN